MARESPSVVTCYMAVSGLDGRFDGALSRPRVYTSATTLQEPMGA